jgi:hypothetical protein
MKINPWLTAVYFAQTICQPANAPHIRVNRCPRRHDKDEQQNQNLNKPGKLLSPIASGKSREMSAHQSALAA